MCVPGYVSFLLKVLYGLPITLNKIQIPYYALCVLPLIISPALFILLILLNFCHTGFLSVLWTNLERAFEFTFPPTWDVHPPFLLWLSHSHSLNLTLSIPLRNPLLLIYILFLSCCLVSFICLSDSVIISLGYLFLSVSAFDKDKPWGNHPSPLHHCIPST